MAAKPIIWFDDRMHLSVSGASVTASHTADGYSPDNVREADLLKAWKAPDGVNDEHLLVDGGSQTWLGDAGDTAWCLIAYDARGSDQVNMYLRYDTLDDPTFATGVNTIIDSFASLNTSSVVCAWKSFTIPDTDLSGSNTPPQYYRIEAPYNGGTDRTGSVTPKILYWAMVGESGVVRIDDTGFAGDTQAEYSISFVDRNGVAVTSALARYINAVAHPGQKFEVNLQPATATAWEAIRNLMFITGGVGRPVFAQFEGIYSPGSDSDFFLCQVSEQERQAAVNFVDQYGFTLKMETVPWL